MSSFEITLKKQSSGIDQLEHAIDNGDIIACSECHSSVFPVSKNKIKDLIGSWEESYPEIKVLERWKNYGSFEYDDDIYGEKNFTSTPIERGEEVLFVFLGIHPTSNTNKLECFELWVKYKFEAYRRQRESEKISLLGRIFRGVSTLGLSEILFAKENSDLNSKEEGNKNLIQRSRNAEVLASMMISKSCPELKIRWE